MTRTPSLPHVLVYEAITGGSWPPGELPPGLAAEGGAMLGAVLADFNAWGRVRTRTTRDRRLRALDLPADQVIEVEPGAIDAEPKAIFADLLAGCDAALVVAPETGGLLTRLSAAVEASEASLLGSSAAATSLAGDKLECYRRFREAGLPTPDTRLAPLVGAAGAARQMGYPLVMKPIDGVGCAGVCLVRHAGELEAACRVLRQATQQDQILLQRFVEGDAASVSLLVAGDRVRPLSVNGQRVMPGCPFAYMGGVVPLAHPTVSRAFAVAETAVHLLPGLSGYVGVDFVLARGDAWLIEVNPRLTTSYVGLRRVLPFNLADAIWRACRQGALPGPAPLTGRAEFSKEGLVQVVPGGQGC